MKVTLRSILAKSTIWLPYIWLLVFFLAPFLIVAKLSISEPAIAQPPYIPTFDFWDGPAGWWQAIGQFSFYNYIFITKDSLYWKSYVSSLQIAVISTFLTLLIGYPMAYGMARAPRTWRPMLLMLVILPF